MGRRYAKRYDRSTRDIGRERALQHIEDARRLTAELGGTDEDVKQYFFSMPSPEMQIILDAYGRQYGDQARAYAASTIEKWRTGRVHMSGTVAGRLFALLPPRMPLSVKYRLIESLWNHVGPRSTKILCIGLDAKLDEVVEAARRHISEVVSSYKIPESLERRFDWLAAGDSHVKQELLIHLQSLEKKLVVEGARLQLPIMFEHLRSPAGSQTHRLAQVLKVGNHELELRMDKNVSGVAIVEPNLFRAPSAGNAGSLKWIWWLAAGLVLLYILSLR